jgi:ubiquinone/menaquinone biosynthesis C-methylase UbiE
MRAFSRMRARIIPEAAGIVAEVGIGSGHNLPYYDPDKVCRIIGIDPDAVMLGIARKRMREYPLRLDLVAAGAECMPLPDASVDTAVITYTLCTIPRPEEALREIRRILKPNGRLLFIEHERSDGPWRGRWQDRLDNAWGRVAGGCHLNRSPVPLIKGAGFVISTRQQERFPLHLWQLGTQSAGVALPA